MLFRSDVQERPKGVGKEKWYRREAVAAKAMAKLESVPVERVVEQAVVPEPALQSMEPYSGLHKHEQEAEVVAEVPELPKVPVLIVPKREEEQGVIESVVVAKKAMNFRFVIGTRGEVVRVQDNKRVKIGMRLAVRGDLLSPGHYVSKEVVR